MWFSVRRKFTIFASKNHVSVWLNADFHSFAKNILNFQTFFYSYPLPEKPQILQMFEVANTYVFFLKNLSAKQK